MKVTEQILNTIIVFAASFKVLKNESKYVGNKNCDITGVVINIQNRIFESVILTGLYTSMYI